MTKQIVCGYEIEVNAKPTTIRLHKLGSPDSSWFTPDELRAFVAALDFARRQAEEETR